MLSSSVDEETAKLFMRLSRPKLYYAMLDQLERVGVKVEFGKDVVDYSEGETAGRAGVILKDGSTHDADIVVAADGARSPSCKLVLGQEVRARPSGDAIFRISYPRSQVMDNPIVLEKFVGGEKDSHQPMMHIYMGYLRHTRPLRSKTNRKQRSPSVRWNL